jgi:uncharacterized protein (DUF1697 family)
VTTWIALLRGINVGGAKKVPMARLRELLEGLGYERVRTYVQSGNVVLDGPARGGARAVAAELSKAIEDEFGFDVLVIVRSRDELAAVIEANPFPDPADAPSRFHVLFLERPVDRGRLAQLDPGDYEPDTFVAARYELYLSTPDGLGTSRLAKALTEKRLGGPVTARNWRTVGKLLEMADETG